MYVGKVIGSVVSTVKNEALKGLKLLAVQVIENGKPGRIIIAADAIRVSGEGDSVYVVTSREAGLAVGSGLIPVDAAIVGIVDAYNLKIEKEIKKELDREGNNNGKRSIRNGGNKRLDRSDRSGRRNGKGG
jgi:ethanolamine utilization protein EutN